MVAIYVLLEWWVQNEIEILHNSSQNCQSHRDGMGLLLSAEWRVPLISTCLQNWYSYLFYNDCCWFLPYGPSMLSFFLYLTRNYRIISYSKFISINKTMYRFLFWLFLKIISKRILAYNLTKETAQNLASHPLLIH